MGLGIFALLALGAVLWLSSRQPAAAATGAGEETSAPLPRAVPFRSVVPSSGPIRWQDEAKRRDVINAIEGWAATLKLDPRWIAAHAKVESSFNPDAINPSDPSFGLMQVVPLIAKAFGGWDGQRKSDLLNVDLNVRAGSKFLKHLIGRYGVLESAIQAYNLGETKFDQGIRVPGYLGRVLTEYRRYGGNV